MLKTTHIYIFIIVVIILTTINIFKKDEYVGFFYPDSSNLLIDIMSEQKFESLDDCRLWAKKTALDYVEDVLEHKNGWDYECGKNCDLSGNKPYVCEETLK